MTKQKSIVEQALLQVQTLEEAVKQNAKGILASTMKEELNSLLKEQEEEDVDPEKEVEDVPTETGDEETSINPDEEIPTDDETSTEDSDEEPSLDDIENPDELEGEEGDDDELLDMTGASPEEVAKVFKAMKPEDGIVVKKEGENISLNVEEPGEYIIKLGELEEQTEGEVTDSDIYEITLDDEEVTDEEETTTAEFDEGKDDPYSKGVGSPLTKGRTEKGLSTSNPAGKGGKPATGDGDPFAKKDGENLTKNRTEKGLSTSNPAGKSGKPATAEGDPFDKSKGEPVTSGDSIRKTVVKGEQTEAARTKLNPHGDKNEAQDRLGIKGKKVYKAGSSSLNEEVETLKKQNAEYKKALVLFKEKLNEVAVFNANLAYATRLFTEHTTTKQEKMDILKRFDSISTITEAKALYGTIKTELDGKKPVTESVAEKITSAPKTSSSTEMLSEAKAYENPEFKRIKDLMKYKG